MTKPRRSLTTPWIMISRLKQAALKLGFVSEAEFDRVVDPANMVKPYVATEAASSGAH